MWVRTKKYCLDRRERVQKRSKIDREDLNVARQGIDIGIEVELIGKSRKLGSRL